MGDTPDHPRTLRRKRRLLIPDPPSIAGQSGSRTWFGTKLWLIAITIIAPVLGGSTERWSQGAVFIGIGVLVLFAPPRCAPGRLLLAVLGGFFALALTGFLPAGWFTPPEWRSQLMAAGVELPWMWSPQPVLTGEAVLLLFGGAVWLCWLAAQSWSATERTWLVRTFTVGTTLFAGTALAFLFWEWVPSFWAAPRGFGPFPNKNQMGNYLGVSGIVAVACAYQAWRERAAAWPLWLLCPAVLLTAQLFSYSRGGVAVLLGGVAGWIAFVCFFTGTMKRFALGGSAVVVLVALFVLFGGEAVERFRVGLDDEHNRLLGFRALIFEDAMRMIAAAPWCGVGLGNFRALFPFWRTASDAPATPIHPESDWLWLGIELGWVGLLVGVGAFAVLIRRVFPLEHGTDRRLRAAALVAAIAFALHGLVDVAGHRLGSVVPAIFVLSLAFAQRLQSRHSFTTALLFRGCGIVLVLVGATWVTAQWKKWPLPGAQGVALAKANTQKLTDDDRFAESIQVSTRALKWAPLDWQLYFSRAVARAWAGEWMGALGDFRRARRLQPFNPEVPLAEGRLWARWRPQLAIPAFQETLERSRPEAAPSLYVEMLSIAPDAPFRAAMRGLAKGKLALQVAFLPHANAGEAAEILQTIREADPSLQSLSESERNAVFVAWAQHGDVEELIRELERSADWRRVGWRVLARYYAERKDHQRACEIAFAHLAEPALPRRQAESPAQTELQRRLLLNPGDFASAYALSSAQLAAGQRIEALETLRRIQAHPGAPAYFAYLEARTAAELGEWEQAWAALLRYPPAGA